MRVIVLLCLVCVIFLLLFRANFTAGASRRGGLLTISSLYSMACVDFFLHCLCVNDWWSSRNVLCVRVRILLT